MRRYILAVTVFLVSLLGLLPASAADPPDSSPTLVLDTVITTTDPVPWTNLYYMTIGDADNDGVPEVFVGTNRNFYAPRIVRFVNNEGNWTQEPLVSGSSSFNAIAGMVIGDADNDGLNELAYGLHKQGNVNGGPLYLMQWTGTGWTTSTVFGGIGDWSSAHAVSDFDNDGVNEILSTVDTYGWGDTLTEPWLFESVGSSWAHESLSSARSRGTKPYSTWAGDVDGDNIDEVIRLKEFTVVSPYWRQTYSVIDCSGTTWQECDIAQLPSAIFAFGEHGGAEVGDVDGDGRDEFVKAYWSDEDNDGLPEAGDDRVVIRVVDYSGGVWTSHDIGSYAKPGTWVFHALAVGDLDADGQAEIYDAAENGVIRVYEYVSGAWEESIIDTGYNMPWYQARVHDVDNDGRLELVLLGSADDRSQFALVAYEAGNQPPTIGIDQPSVTVNEGQTASNTGTYSDPDGDPLTLTASIGTVVDNGSGTWSWSVQTTDGPEEGRTVTITADDGDETTSVPFDLTVQNVAPSVGPITAPIDPVEVNTPFAASAPFTDPGVLDTHTASWDWGDGNSSPGSVTEVDGSGTATGSHTYATPGVYTIAVTVTDKDGDSGSAFFQYVVVYDPEGGFVTGGGWIDSPEGAYVADPSLTGKATFGFVSKYKRGAHVPTGQTEFQFKIADLNFHSEAYDWLVVAGAKAMYKGVGTINGEGEYKFLLKAIDADVNDNDAFDIDRFRIKIWTEDAAGNEVVVYDNGLGLDAYVEEETEDTTEIGGGSIVVHKAK